MQIAHPQPSEGPPPQPSEGSQWSEVQRVHQSMQDSMSLDNP